MADHPNRDGATSSSCVVIGIPSVLKLTTNDDDTSHYSRDPVLSPSSHSRKGTREVRR